MISGFVKTIDLKPTAHCYAGSLEFQILAKWRTQSQTVERKKKTSTADDFSEGVLPSV